MTDLPSEAEMHKFRDRSRLGWGVVSVLVMLELFDATSSATKFVLCLAAASLGGFLGGELYAWSWRVRARAWVEESVGAGLINYSNKNWGPLWRKFTAHRDK